MPLKVGSVILCQYWPMLVVCAASNAEVRRSVCTSRGPYSPSWCLAAALSIIRRRPEQSTMRGLHSASGLFRSDTVRKSRDKDELAGGAGLQDFLVGAGRFRERQLLADDSAERAVLQTGDEPSVDFRDFRGLKCPQRECENRRATRHNVAWRDGGIAAAADDDDAAVQSQHLEIAAEVYVCQHFEDDIYASTAGCFHDLVLVSRLGVIERFVRPFTLHQLYSSVGASGAKYSQPHSPGNLQRRCAY